MFTTGKACDPSLLCRGRCCALLALLLREMQLRVRTEALSWTLLSLLSVSAP